MKIPKILYKYRDWSDEDHKKILTHNEIWISSPKQFNDPFDCALPFKYNREDLTEANIYLKLRSIIKHEEPWLNDEQLEQACFVRQQATDFTNPGLPDEEYDKMMEDVDSRFGILSLSKKKDHLLMWSHYSNCHKGFCVGINPDALISSSEGLFRKVIYSKYFPEMPLFADSAEQVKSIERLLVTKSPGWKYESEFRYITRRRGKFIVTLPDSAIKEIALGVKMPDEQKNEIFLLAKSKFPDAKIFECRRNKSTFKLDFIPLIKSSN